MKIRSKSENDTGIAEMILWCNCVKILHKRLFSLKEINLNAVSRRKFGYVQQSVLSRTRTDLDQQTTLVLLRLYHAVCLGEVSLQ